jgi:hypothetical protein
VTSRVDKSRDLSRQVMQLVKTSHATGLCKPLATRLFARVDIYIYIYNCVENILLAARLEKRGRKKLSMAKINVFLLRKCNTDYLPSVGECASLQRQGYGIHSL